MSKENKFGFLDNPMIKKLAFGQLKKVMDAEKITLITVTRDEAGEFVFTPYSEDMVVISRENYFKLLKLATE